MYFLISKHNVKALNCLSKEMLEEMAAILMSVNQAKMKKGVLMLGKLIDIFCINLVFGKNYF